MVQIIKEIKGTVTWKCAWIASNELFDNGYIFSEGDLVFRFYWWIKSETPTHKKAKCPSLNQAVCLFPAGNYEVISQFLKADSMKIYGKDPKPSEGSGNRITSEYKNKG